MYIYIYVLCMYVFIYKDVDTLAYGYIDTRSLFLKYREQNPTATIVVPRGDAEYISLFFV